MIIGVDAGALSISDDRLKVGVYRVTFELLKNLSLIDQTNEYRLYSFQLIHKKILKNFSMNMKNIVLSPAAGYFSFRLPLELLLHPVDAFLGVSQAVPVMTKGKAIGFVYDIGFIHAPHLYGKDADKLRVQTKNLVKRSSQIVTNSYIVKKEIMKAHALDETKVSVFPAGVSDVFRSSSFPLKRKHSYFLFVGSLRKGKNIVALLKIFHEFLKHSNEIYDLVLVGGDFWPDETIDITMKALHLEDRVVRTGVVSDETLARYYRGAVAFVTTSVSEGFCLPAAEAMASGCPVIAYDVGAIREVVGDAGILVPFGKNAIFEKAMKLLAADGKKRRTLGVLGKRNATKYTWNDFSRNILHIIHADTP